MTFFVCIYLLLGFLIKDSFIIYVKDSGNKEVDNSHQGSSNEPNANKSSAPQHILDLEALLNKQNKEALERLNKDKEARERLNKDKESKQDSSNVVNDGSEPTPLTDLDGGD